MLYHTIDTALVGRQLLHSTSRMSATPELIDLQFWSLDVRTAAERLSCGIYLKASSCGQKISPALYFEQSGTTVRNCRVDIVSCRDVHRPQVLRSTSEGIHSPHSTTLESRGGGLFMFLPDLPQRERGGRRHRSATTNAMVQEGGAWTNAAARMRDAGVEAVSQ